MVDGRKVSVVVLAGLLAAGCGSNGGGGGGGSSAGLTGGSTSSPTTTASSGPNGPISSDFTAPDIAITRPARGEYFSGANTSLTVEGTATDAETGVMLLTLNGQPIHPDATGHFTTTITMEPGTNILVARATDWAAHQSTAAVSVMYCEAYRLATEDIPGAAGTRINEQALNTIAPVVAQQIMASGAVQSQLLGSPLYHGDVRDPLFNTCIASAEASVTNLTFGAPQITFDSVQNGLNANVHIPNLDIDARVHSYCGIPYSVSGGVAATDAVIDVGIDVTVANGAYVCSARSATVSLVGFQFNIGGIPQVITNIVRSALQSEIEKRLADVIKNEVPKRVNTQLAQLGQPITRTWNGRTVTFRVAPERIAFDDAGLQVDFLGNVTAAKHPNTPIVPGSVFLAPPAGQVPQFGTGFGFYGGLNQNVMNRALFTSWQAGFWTLTIDSAFLQQMGVSLPFQLDGNLIAIFFPAIRGMITPGQRVPLQLKFEPKMQPVFNVVGQPDLLELELGECHMSLLLDFGSGFQPLFDLALHIKAATSVNFANNALSFQTSQNVQVEVDMLSTALPLNGIDVERFVAFLSPAALQVATQSMRPIPIPTVQGLSLANLSAVRDGQRGEFVTISGDVR